MIRIFTNLLEFGNQMSCSFPSQGLSKRSSLCLCTHTSLLHLQTPTHLCNLSNTLLTSEKTLVSSVINSHGSFTSLFSNIHPSNNVLFNVYHFYMTINSMMIGTISALFSTLLPVPSTMSNILIIDGATGHPRVIPVYTCCLE